MRDKVVNKIMIKIKENNIELDNVKLAEIKYGLQGLYTLITKTTIIILLSLLLNIFSEFIIFFIFYSILRSVGFGTHANSNLKCWIFSTLFLLGIPILMSNIKIKISYQIILWIIIFINFLIFAPADTKRRPMINKKRKLKFKFIILIFSIIYLFIIVYFKNISNLVLGSMLLEAMLVNPIGYILMGEEVRFRLNDIFLFKQN